MSGGRLLLIVVCGAGPAAHVERLVSLAHAQDWRVQIVATPSGAGFIDTVMLQQVTGNAVRTEYRSPGEPRSEMASAIVVAPATYNTINKLAAGISDTYALGVLAEAIGMGLPIVVVPFVNSALARRRPFRRSLRVLRGEGVTLLFECEGGTYPHEPHAGGDLISEFPWAHAIETIATS